MVKIIWTKRAFDQLARSIKYIRDEQGISPAETVLNKILKTIRLLEDSPKMGTVEPLLAHKKTEYRFMLIWSYKIIYRLMRDNVVISRVFHTSRNPKKLKGI